MVAYENALPQSISMVACEDKNVPQDIFSLSDMMIHSTEIVSMVACENTLPQCSYGSLL